MRGTPDLEILQAIAEGAFRRLTGAELACYLQLVLRAGTPPQPVTITQDELGLVTGLARRSVMRGLRGLVTKGLLQVTRSVGPVPARYELQTPEAAGLTAAQAEPVRFEVGASVAVNFNVEPTNQILTADDYATFQAVRESFSPEVHAQYHADAVQWFRRRYPGVLPDAVSLERVRDRLIISEHFGPDRQRRYAEHLAVLRDRPGGGGERR